MKVIPLHGDNGIRLGVGNKHTKDPSSSKNLNTCTLFITANCEGNSMDPEANYIHQNTVHAFLKGNGRGLRRSLGEGVCWAEILTMGNTKTWTYVDS